MFKQGIVRYCSIASYDLRGDTTTILISRFNREADGELLLLRAQGIEIREESFFGGVCAK